MRSPTSAFFKLPLIGFAFCFLIGPHPTTAAEVSCVQQYGARAATIEEHNARRAWSSGFRPSQESCHSALISGIIERGDYERVKVLLQRDHRALMNIFLQSPGGDADEAMKIGRLLRKSLLTVTAPHAAFQGDPFKLRGLIGTQSICSGPTCICASACALIWFGAVDRSGVVGLHRPKITDPRYNSLPAGDAIDVYKKALQNIGSPLFQVGSLRSSFPAMR